MKFAFGLLVGFVAACVAQAQYPAFPGFENLAWNTGYENTNLHFSNPIPTWLKGSLYRNGGANWNYDKQDVDSGHW